MPVDAPVETAARLRLVTGRLARRLRRTRAGEGLTPTTRSVLVTVVRCGPLRLGDLAAEEGLHPTMLSRVVATLAEQGLVSRTPDPQDGRAALVAATPEGQRLRERMQRERNDAIAVHLAALDAEERDTLDRALPVLERLADALAKDRRP